MSDRSDTNYSENEAPKAEVSAGAMAGSRPSDERTGPYEDAPPGDPLAEAIRSAFCATYGWLPARILVVTAPTASGAKARVCVTAAGGAHGFKRSEFGRDRAHALERLGNEMLKRGHCRRANIDAAEARLKAAIALRGAR